MRRLFLIVTAWTLVVAKPELYREKEDFQYSRSSSDDGSKSGFYGAQRGNMGGNFEKAHNMDGLAQHQMSGLVRQVEGELGDASKTKTGSVFTAANSRGVYGSGNYDLSNLEGRNFQEGMSYGGSNSHSSLSSYGSGYNGHLSSSLHSAGYSQSQNSRHSSGSTETAHSRQNLHSNNLHTADNIGVGTYEYGSQASSGYQAQSGYHGQSAYDYSNVDQQSSNGQGSNVHSRLISTVPVRIVVRPGTKVTVPVAAQTYDATHSASSYDQNAINSEAEVLNNAGHERNPTNAKHYESSYKYHKEWEKHDTKPVAVPLAVPTINPFPKNNELYDGSQIAQVSDQLEASGIDSQSAHSSSVNSRYNANIKSSSASQSRYQTGYNAQHHSSSRGSNTNAYTHGAYNTGSAADLTNAINDADTSPKSYQSSFSYHKSWERQGDPYIIKPSTNGLYDAQSSQRLTASSTNQGGYSSQYGSNQKQFHQSYSQGSALDCDCDENGHIRVARSYNNDQVEIDQQQSEKVDDGLEEMGQQVQSGWENLEDLGQQTQSKLENLENLGQETQEKWQLEDLGQQTQNKWDKLDIGQQTQNKWDNLEELGQQTYNNWNNQENIAQINQNKMDREEIEQTIHNKWDNLETVNQQIQNKRTEPQRDAENNENFKSTINIPKDVSHDKAVSSNQQQSNSYHEPRQIQSTWDKLNNIETYQNINHNDNIQLPKSYNQEDNNSDQINWNQISQHENLNQKEHNLTNDLEVLKKSEVNENNKVDLAKEQTQETSIINNQNIENRTINEKSDKSVRNSTNGVFWSSTQDQTQQHNGVYKYNNQFSSSHGGYDSNMWANNGYSSSFSHTSNSQNLFTGTNTNSYLFPNYYNSQINTQDGLSTQSAWDKINRMDKELSLSNNKEESNGNIDSHRGSQQSSQGWKQIQTYHSMDNLGLTQNVNEQNQFSSHYGGYKPFQWTTWNNGNKDISTTEKSNNDQHSQDKQSRPIDVGRGDIDDAETSQNLGNDEEHPQVLVSDSSNKRHKTAEEIEKLSLTKEVSSTNKPTDYSNINDPIHYTHGFQTTNQQSDSALGVISLNEQKKLQEHGQNINLPVTSTITPKIETNYNNEYIQNVNKEHFVQSGHQKHELVNERSNESNNDIINITIPISENDQNVQIPEELEQNIKQVENFGQQSENLDQQVAWGQNMEDFGQQTGWGQNLEDFGQQSQSAWGQNLEDLGQQTQTDWGSDLENLEQVKSDKIPNANLEQLTDTQERFTSPAEEKQQKHDFYRENYQYNKNKNREHAENLHDPKAVAQKESDVDVPQELTTEKPGFWKSVGNKFTSAKDTVAGWFSRS